MNSNPKLIAGLLMAFGASFHIGFRYTMNKKSSNIPFPTEHQRKQVFDEKGSQFDKELDFDEWMFGISNWRSELLKSANGNVLEVAAGTGRNIDYYLPDRVYNLTFIDFSRPLLKAAVEKNARFGKIPTKFSIQNALQINFDDKTFDTVVDTFGVCSYEYPVETLQEIRRVLKDEGKLLLLEHGDSSFSPLSRYMQNKVGFHANHHGCYYNRDIIHIVQQAGFVIEHEKRKILGTIYLIVAKKAQLEESSTSRAETAK